MQRHCDALHDGPHGRAVAEAEVVAVLAAGDRLACEHLGGEEGVQRDDVSDVGCGVALWEDLVG